MRRGIGRGRKREQDKEEIREWEEKGLWTKSEKEGARDRDGEEKDSFW